MAATWTHAHLRRSAGSWHEDSDCRAAGHEALLPTVETISAGRYPLDRDLLIHARRPLTPFAREFMRLMLSREGQEAVAATPLHYLPLSAAEAAVERAKLGQ